MYVFVPAQTGSADTTGAEGVSTLPQLSKTTGGVGVTALAAQDTVDAPGAGNVTVGGAIV